MDRVAFILATIRAAGAELMLLRAGVLDVQIKEGDPKNIVTDADLRINAMITDAITKNFPSESIYSEEKEGGISQTGVQWVIDPIDGTANFSRGIPHFAICLGVVEDGVPIVGAVYNPVTNELFSFEKGKGARLNEKPIRVSAIAKLSKSTILLRAGRKKELAEWGGRAYSALLENAWKTCGFGSAALDTCFVAAGRAEASIYGTFSTADVAPAIGILLEAGGVLVTPAGEPAPLGTDAQTTIAGNSTAMTDQLRTLLFT